MSPYFLLFFFVYKCYDSKIMILPMIQVPCNVRFFVTSKLQKVERMTELETSRIVLNRFFIISLLHR